MRLSSKTDYGLRALIDLALHTHGVPVQSHDIAARQGIPESYLNQLLILLRRAGLIRSVRGPQGGHQLARAAHTITLADIVGALDGPPANEQPSVPAEARGTDRATDAVVRETWERVSAAMLDALRGVTLDALLDARQQHDAAAMFQI
jgi:Rrf2 family cysteine metabolism transcriptional repressor